MQLIIAPIASACDRSNDRSWREVGAPEPALMRLFGLQISVLLAAALFVAWAIAAHFADLRPRYWMIVAAAVLVAPLHELTHALAFPRAAHGAQCALAFWPRRFALCAQYDGVLRRNRYLLVLLMPLLAISLVPMAACALLELGSVPRLCVVLFLFNALVSGDDVLAALLVVTQVPADGLIRKAGDVTLWKAGSSPPKRA
jgi:putative zincin peptidase